MNKFSLVYAVLKGNVNRQMLYPLDCKEIQPVHSKGDQSWVFFERTDAKAETPILWPPHVKSWLTGKDWCWEGLGTGGGGNDPGWDGWMASLTQWTWVWVNSGRWWWTGRPGVLWFMGSQRVGHNWVTELNWILGLVQDSEHLFLHIRPASHNFYFFCPICVRYFNLPLLVEAICLALYLHIFSVPMVI